MKIFFDHRIFFHQNSGGISRYIINLSRQFDKMNKPSFISSPFHINTMLKDYYKVKKNIFGRYIYKKPRFTNSLLNFINTLITSYNLKKINPNVYHQTYYGDFLCEKKIIKVVTVHDLIHEKFHKYYGFDKNWRPKLNSLQQADKIICVSENTKEDLNKFYDTKNKQIKVIYHGSDHLTLKKNFSEKNKRENFILYVGGRGKYKNFIKFVESYANNHELKKNFKVVCFGGGQFNEKEFKLFNEKKIKDQILYEYGDDENLINLYKKAACLVYPSLYEGFGIPIIEAMSFGCPVAASNSISLKESCGEAAFIFDQNSSQGISDAIIKAINSINDDKISLGIIHTKKFTWRKCAEETLKFYEN